MLARLACLAVAGFVGLSSCSPSPADEEEQSQATVVQVRVAVEKSWRETLDLSAEVLPWAAVTLAAEASGRVSELPVEEGDRVPQGAVILRLDAAEAEALLAQAGARMASSTATLAQAERDLERGRSLVGSDGLISEDELDRLALAAEVARASLLEARAGHLVVEERLADSVLRAPFAGVIGQRFVEIGSWVAPGQALLRLVDSDRVKVRGAASQADRVGLTIGTPVQVRALALEKDVFRGTLRLLGQEVDEGTGTYRVEASVTDVFGSSQHRLLPGMHAVMSIEMTERRAITIPESAVLGRGENASVFVIEDGIARHRSLAVESLGTGEVAVHSGLVAGDAVVVGGQYGLQDGVLVDVEVP